MDISKGRSLIPFFPLLLFLRNMFCLYLRPPLEIPVLFSVKRLPLTTIALCGFFYPRKKYRVCPLFFLTFVRVFSPFKPRVTNRPYNSFFCFPLFLLLFPPCVVPACPTDRFLFNDISSYSKLTRPAVSFSAGFF